MKKILFLTTTFFFSSLPLEANICRTLFLNDRISQNDWNNAIKRIYNVYQNDTFLLQTKNGQQEILLLFEGVETHLHHNESNIRHLADEIISIKDRIDIKRLESSINNFMPMAEINSKTIPNTRIPKETMENSSKRDYQKALQRFKKERRFLKMSSGLTLAISNMLLAQGILTIPLPGIEILIPLSISASAIYYYHYYRGLNQYYRRVEEAFEARIENAEEADKIKMSTKTAMKALLHHLKESQDKSVFILPEEIKTIFLQQASRQDRFYISDNIYRN